MRDTLRFVCQFGVKAAGWSNFWGRSSSHRKTSNLKVYSVFLWFNSLFDIQKQFSFPKNQQKIDIPIYFAVIALLSLYILLSSGRFHLMESEEGKSTLSFPFHNVLLQRFFTSAAFKPSVFPSFNVSVQANTEDPRSRPTSHRTV